MQADFCFHIKSLPFPKTLCRPAVLQFPGNIKAVFNTRAWDSNENSVDLKSQPDLRGDWKHHFIRSRSCESQHTVLSQVGVEVLWSKSVPCSLESGAAVSEGRL